MTDVARLPRRRDRVARPGTHRALWPLLALAVILIVDGMISPNFFAIRIVEGRLFGNLISHASGAAGMAVGLKEASDVIIENNEIIYCAVGIGSDISPFEPDSKIIMRGNRFAYNGIGISFTSDIGGTEVTGNDFDGNPMCTPGGPPRIR